MKTVLIFFLPLLCLVSGFAIGKHSLKDEPNLDIIDGNKTSITQYPFLASILMLPHVGINGSYLGSGVIVHRYWILTTAGNGAMVMADWVRIRVGTDSRGKGGKILPAHEILWHSSYTGTYDYDIALIKLKKPIKFTSNIKPIRINKGDLKGGVQAMIAGWGQTKKSNPTPSSTLYSAELTVLERETCIKKYGSNQITSRQLCTYDTNTGPCEYDSGDPLVFNNTLHGIYSGSSNCLSMPAVFTDMQSFYTWVWKIIEDE